MKIFLIIGILLAVIKGRNPVTIIKNVEFQWPLLIIGSFGIQIALAGFTLYTTIKLELVLVLTFTGVIIGLVKNKGISGMKWIIIGCMLNLCALLLHNGLMPVSTTAMKLTGQDLGGLEADSRHQLMESGTLTWIVGDWIPFFHYVLSPGDLFVGIGLILFIYRNSSSFKGNIRNEND